MAKADLLKEAHALGLDVTDDNTVAEIEAALAAASPAQAEDSAEAPVDGPRFATRRKATNLVRNERVESVSADV